MRVLKKGRPQKEWAKEFTCTGAGFDGGGCGAELLVEKGDLFIAYSWAREERKSYLCFRCVECGVRTEIDRDELGKKLGSVWDGVRDARRGDLE